MGGISAGSDVAAWSFGPNVDLTCGPELTQTYGLEPTAAARAGISTIAAAPAWTTSWKPTQGALDAVAAAPFVRDGAVYTVGPDDLLHAVDIGSGRELWTFGRTNEQWVVNFLPTSRGLLVLVDGWGGSVLISLDPDGHALWKRTFEAPRPFTSSLSVARDTIFLIRAGIDDSSGMEIQPPALVAIAMIDGGDIWTRPLPHPPVGFGVTGSSTFTTAADRTVVVHQAFADKARRFGRPARTFVAGFDQVSGATRWEVGPMEGTEQPIGVFGGNLVATEWDAYAIVRRDPDNGRVLDRYTDCLSHNAPAGYAVDGSRVYWLQLTELVAANLGTDRRLWSLPLGRGGSLQSTLPAVVDGHLYVGASNGGYLYSIDAQRGTVDWRFAVRENGRYGPRPIRVGDLLLVQYEQLTAYRIP